MLKNLTIPVITVDGPSSSGKSTLCKELSKILKWNLLDSGAIYRTLSLVALRNKLSSENKEKLIFFAKNLDIHFSIKKNKLIVISEGKDISEEIRNDIVGLFASKIAEFPYIRNILLELQRKFRNIPGLIADGRDMGTVVFPDAKVKIFLKSSIKIRTIRRMRQLKEKNINVSFKNILSKIEERDERDKNRIISPLVPAKDAFILDSTFLESRKVTIKTLKYIRKIIPEF